MAFSHGAMVPGHRRKVSNRKTRKKNKPVVEQALIADQAPQPELEPEVVKVAAEVEEPEPVESGFKRGYEAFSSIEKRSDREPFERQYISGTGVDMSIFKKVDDSDPVKPEDVITEAELEKEITEGAPKPKLKKKRKKRRKAVKVIKVTEVSEPKPKE